MNKLKRNLMILAFCILSAGAQAASKEWLHIHVDETREEGERVRVNIPLSLVEVMLPMVKDKDLTEGKIRLDDKDFKVSDLRKVWNTVKSEGDSEFVTVEKKGENVRVFTQGNFLMVESTKGSHGQVNIKLPMAVVDAMLSGDGDQLDLMAGVKALRDSNIKDIISVEDEDSKVLVWIDDKNMPVEKE